MTPHIKSLIQHRQVLYKNNQIEEWLTTAKQVQKLCDSFPKHQEHEHVAIRGE